MVRPVTPSVPTTFKLPAELNVEVAEPPKYAVSNTDSRVEEAWPRVVRPLTVKLEAEVWVGLNVPVTVRAPTTVDDACDTKPPLEPKVVRPVTLRAPPKVFVPVVVNAPTTVEDAAETYPPVKVERPVTPRVEPKALAPVVVNAPTTVDDACETEPATFVTSPVSVEAPVTDRAPCVVISVLIVVVA